MLLGGGAVGTVVGGGPGVGTVVGGVAGGTIVEVGCAIAVDRWANADFESLLSENRQKSTDDDSGTDDEDADPEPEADPKPTAAEIKQKYDEINEAYRRYRNGEITAAEMQQAVQRFTRWRCEEMGHTNWCNR